MLNKKSAQDHFAHQQCLEGKAQPFYDEDRYDIMERIQEYLDACYFLSFNPLHQLRRAFPQYIWSYHQLETLREAQQKAQDADFIWRGNLSCLSELDGYELFLATQRVPRRPLKIFFAGSKNASESTTELIEASKALHCEAEYTEVTNA